MFLQIYVNFIVLLKYQPLESLMTFSKTSFQTLCHNFNDNKRKNGLPFISPVLCLMNNNLYVMSYIFTELDLNHDGVVAGDASFGVRKDIALKLKPSPSKGKRGRKPSKHKKDDTREEPSRQPQGECLHWS